MTLRARQTAVVALVALAACRDFDPDPTGPVTPPPPPPAGSAMPFRIGSFAADFARAIATDVVGNGYVASYFNGSVDFDPTAASTIRASLGGNDIAVAKYAPSGSLTWVASLGGAANDQPADIATTVDGGVVITGFVGPGLSCGGAVPVIGGRDIVVARFSSSGACQWAIAVGGTQDDEGRGIAVRADGRIVVAGLFRGVADFDPTNAVAPLTSRGGSDGFVAVYSASGVFLSVAQIGGTEDDVANALAVLGNTDVVVGGEFRGLATLGTGFTAVPLTSAGETDFFLARFGAQLDLTWAVRGGGTQTDQVATSGITVNPGGSIIAVGTFTGVTNVATGSTAVPLSSAGVQDVFVARYDPNGLWEGLAVRLGGAGSDGALATGLDGSGNLLISGWFQGTVDFDPGPGTRPLTGLGTAGAGDAYVLSLDPAGNLRWVAPIGAQIAGDANFALASGVAADPDGIVWAAGRFFGTVDLDPGPATAVIQSGGDADQFVVRYNAATGALER